jgi:NADH-quinone oxidoreductase subunit N
MLVGLAVGDVGSVGGTSAVLFYLAVYGLMTIGVFALLTGLGSAERPLQTDDDLRGLSSVRPTAALLLAVCLFSLTGLPPTVGFLGKLNLFLSAWSAETTLGKGLAAMLALNAAIAAWYYLRLIARMFLEPMPRGDEAPPPVDWVPCLAGAACAVATVILFVAPQELWNAVQLATGHGS